MQKPPEQWHVHIGAHKTATTHAQEILGSRRAELAELGICFHGRDILRRRRLESLCRPGRQRIKDADVIRSLRRAWSMFRLRPTRQPRVMLLSEESMLGAPRQLLEGCFYPEAAERMRNLGDMLGGGPITLFLSVRNPATLLPSAYTQCLRGGIRDLPRMPEVESINLRMTPTWTDLVRRIREGLPRARLVAWRFEDYIASQGGYLDMLVGAPVGGWPARTAPASTRGLSAETIGRILSLDGSLGSGEHRARCRELCKDDDGSRPWRPFSSDTMARMSEAYEADIAQLEQSFPGVLHRGRSVSD